MKGSLVMKKVHFRLRPAGQKIPRPTSGEIPITYWDPLSLTAPAPVVPSKLPIRPGHEESTEILRLTYELSAVQADLALYQQWHGAAMEFFKEVRHLEASFAAVIGVFKQVGSRLRGCCDGNQPQLTINEDRDRLGRLDRFHKRYHRARQSYDDGLAQLQDHWKSIERARTRFEAQPDRIDQEYRQSEARRALHGIPSRP
ncbi:hypothetical protein PMAA_008250 [Talaromyces marneffei ATCC 18224]|uniref:Uncharacterized protein n=3 Tax=Talaromyces marneffei TaxID=37727 RepID=B6QWG8_TALMQ|nr:hypothetical protein PMAA_008250 [Talaromyces marneffei ATCC 18224]